MCTKRWLDTVMANGMKMTGVDCSIPLYQTKILNISLVYDKIFLYSVHILMMSMSVVMAVVCGCYWNEGNTIFLL